MFVQLQKWWHDTGKEFMIGGSIIVLVLACALGITNEFCQAVKVARDQERLTEYKNAELHQQWTAVKLKVELVLVSGTTITGTVTRGELYGRGDTVTMVDVAGNSVEVMRDKVVIIKIITVPPPTKEFQYDN
jgi:hypothetical protein